MSRDEPRLPTIGRPLGSIRSGRFYYGRESCLHEPCQRGNAGVTLVDEAL
jgi:hypothetical protein